MTPHPSQPPAGPGFEETARVMTEIARDEYRGGWSARVSGAGVAAWAKEARALIMLGGPLILTQLANIAVHTTDVIMIGAVSKEALAAAALGTTVFFFGWLVGYGPAAAVSPMVAQILGARPQERAAVRASLRMGLWAVAMVSPPLMLLMLAAEDVLLALGQPPALAAEAAPYVQLLAIGLPFSIGFGALRNFATALSRPNLPLAVMAATVIINGVGNYAFIYGELGAPELGLVGAGIASAFAHVFSFATMLAVLVFAPEFRPYRILRRFHRPDWEKLGEIFRIGVPIGMTMIFEAMLFNSATLLMGAFGTAPLAAHQIAINVPSVTFMVPLGIAMAATVRVGLAAGARDMDGVRRAGLAAIVMGTAFMGLCGIVMGVFPAEITGLYIAAHAPENAAVVGFAAVFLRVAAAFQIFDALQVTAAFALRGLKDTRVPMLLAGGSYWIVGFPLCLLLGFGLGLEGFGIWVGLAVALAVAAAAMLLRFSHKAGIWR